MKKKYEIALMQHVSGSVADDYETVDFISWCSTYFEFKRMAKEISKHIGQTKVPHSSYSFTKREADKHLHTQPLDEGLAMVKIVCYTKTDYSEYEPLYYEYYENGKVAYKINFQP